MMSASPGKESRKQLYTALFECKRLRGECERLELFGNTSQDGVIAGRAAAAYGQSSSFARDAETPPAQTSRPEVVVDGWIG